MESTNVRSQAAKGSASPRRYVGRGGSAASSGSLPAAEIRDQGSAVHARPRNRGASTPGARGVAVRAMPWSFTLILSVSVISAILIAWRLSGAFTPPLDAPTGVEATQAAFANLLAGNTSGALDPLRLWPAPAPWHGASPTNPASGLPLYGWITAGAMSYLGAGDWSGRAVSLLFSLLAGLLLFFIVRRTAGARASLYALLFFAISPLSSLVGQQFAPGSLLLAAQSWAILTLVQWRSTVAPEQPTGSLWPFLRCVVASATAALLDPGSIFLIAPAAYIVLAPGNNTANPVFSRNPRAAIVSWRDAWEQSPNRGRLLGLGATLVGAALLYLLLSTSAGDSLTLASGDGGGGASAILSSLFNGGTYVQIVGMSIERMLTLAGLLFLLAGVLRGARPPLQLLFHVWLAGALLHVLFDGSRLARHEDVLLPLLLPACALVGVGAGWAGSLPARVWLAITEQRREADVEYTISPHTAWLLRLPEEEAAPASPSRPQAQIALGKSVAERSRHAGAVARRAWLVGAGHVLVLLALGIVAVSGWRTTYARMQTSEAALVLLSTGHDVAGATPPGSRLIIAGPSAPELFYSSGRTGWAIAADDFRLADVQRLQRDGAAYLLSTDQEWLGHHPDYMGLLANYSVARLSRDYILFDLNTKPSANDRLYFLQSGHTLGGEFRRFWETHGSVARLGYPVSEELREPNPIDEQTRTIQYFERGILEAHPEFSGTKDAVMLAAVGLWATVGKTFPRVAPFQNTADRAYFPETGHSVKEAFLRYWLEQGGLAAFGYPISEELPEISPADGKVYTVQYFERARFEWHPTDAGTADAVQLGLIGKQALERAR